jgi:pseudouridine synthase
VDVAAIATLTDAVAAPDARGRVEQLSAQRVEIRKASARETHLIVDLVEGRNRELRRMFSALGHEATRVHRIAFGRVELGDLQPGEWRDVPIADV